MRKIFLALILFSSCTSEVENNSNTENAIQPATVVLERNTYMFVVISVREIIYLPKFVPNADSTNLYQDGFLLFPDTVKYLSPIYTYKTFDNEIKYREIDRVERDLINSLDFKKEKTSNSNEPYIYYIIDRSCRIMDSYESASKIFHSEPGQTKRI